MTIEELGKKIENDINAGKTIEIIGGPFGERPGEEGFTESITAPADKPGVFTKFYGCPFIWNGEFNKTNVERIGLAKSMISKVGIDIISASYWIMFCLGTMYLFARKRFYHYLQIYVEMIHHHSVYKVAMPENRYCRANRELLRTIHKVASSKPDNIFYQIAKTLLEFVVLVLESDFAYRSRIQDIIPLVNKKLVAQGVRKEVDRLMDILIQRETQLVIRKWKQIRWVLSLALLLNKDIRNFVREFLLELNLDEVKMDENDFYFSLGRFYDMKGLNMNMRLKMRQQIDKEKEIYRVRVAGNSKTEMSFTIEPEWG